MPVDFGGEIFAYRKAYILAFSKLAT